MNRSYFAALFAASILLAACGGGGGGGGSTLPGAGGNVATPTPTLTPSGTTAQGTLVDDPSSTPLSGVSVRLDPWTVYPTPGPTPTPIATTTTDPSGHFSISAKNGAYLLVIGSDSNTDTTRPTIHDKIVLNGQTVLTAPTMPPFPGVTPPAVETSGNYRLANIDPAKELPCIQEWDAQRTSHSLPLPVVDQWLTENARAAQTQSQTSFIGQVSPNNPYGFLTSANAKVQGGTDCKGVIDYTFTHGDAYALNPGSVWFAGAYLPYQGGTYSAYGINEFPYDPRIYTDPSAVAWP